ncbi:hypothetical protein DERF_000633 [Dermatophagoides farinae]|uniref:Uncharacterized protein n=1 Tax=Dermatophagoides farinae TaxID=6954 RepID=A0A922LAD5_DERFA|nr:hypothetical protein DERF_000633 [Dermatophagoides farinae]
MTKKNQEKVISKYGKTKQKKTLHIRSEYLKLFTVKHKLFRHHIGNKNVTNAYDEWPKQQIIVDTNVFYRHPIINE